jgi:hypothetical protein
VRQEWSFNPHEFAIHLEQVVANKGTNDFRKRSAVFARIELLHLFVHNHGKLWKRLMRARLGDYERLEKQLFASTSPKRASPAGAFIRSPNQSHRNPKPIQ